MNSLSEYTPTELLKKINDSKIKHDELKTKILDYVNDIEFLEKKINDSLIELEEIEKNYVDLIDELNNR